MNALAGPLYIVTGVLVAAGVAKMLRPSATATALRALRVPQPLSAARAMGIAEVVIGLLAIAIGSPYLWALVAVVYAAFTGFVLWALQAEANVGSCGCFGQEDTPPTPGHAAFNAAASALALLAAFDPIRPGDFDGTAFEAMLFVGLVGIGIAASVLALTSLPRVLALVSGSAAATVPEFGIRTASGNGMEGRS